MKIFNKFKNSYNDIIIVLQNEYIKGIKRKSFIIFSLVPLLVLLLFFSSRQFLSLENNFVKKIILIDYSDTIRANYNLEFYYLSDNLDHALAMVQNNEYHGVLKYNVGQKNIAVSTLYTKIELSDNQKQYIERELERIYLNELLTLKGINIEDLQKQSKNAVILSSINIGTTSEKKFSFLKAIAYISVFLIYICIFQFSSLVMKSISSEKNSRIIEIILSSIRAYEFVSGKILGAGLLGLTQFAIWIIGCVIIINLTKGDGSMSNLDSNVINDLYMYVLSIDFVLSILFLLLFFLFGFFLYAAIFAVIGSSSNQYTDSQQFVMPITLPLLIAFIYCYQYIGVENGLVHFLSYFPLTSPVGMLSRIPFGIPYTEIFISLLILIVSVIVTTHFAGKVLLQVILDFSNQFKFGNIIRLLKRKC
ncbi:MAG: ABC transporter permease [Bacteroidales bacterium]|nr:ABC transporter permease [Bacteroidales bacterium]